MINERGVRSGVLRDPRLRGHYMDFLTRRRKGGPVSRPGMDANRAQQGINAAQGSQYHTAFNTPRYTMGQRLQQGVRNRSTEQAGVQRPAQPASIPTQLPMRRF